MAGLKADTLILIQTFPEKMRRKIIQHYWRITDGLSACGKHKVKNVFVGNADTGLTVSQQPPAELVEGGQGEERAISFWLLHQHRDFLSPRQQQPPETNTKLSYHLNPVTKMSCWSVCQCQIDSSHKGDIAKVCLSVNESIGWSATLSPSTVLLQYPSNVALAAQFF